MTPLNNNDILMHMRKCKAANYVMLFYLFFIFAFVVAFTPYVFLVVTSDIIVFTMWFFLFRKQKKKFHALFMSLSNKYLQILIYEIAVCFDSILTSIALFCFTITYTIVKENNKMNLVARVVLRFKMETAPREINLKAWELFLLDVGIKI